jgi:2',3'-cyclic-nucleotide 2'-phosphodiesterase (5'-nucleotidase family)
MKKNIILPLYLALVLVSCKTTQPAALPTSVSYDEYKITNTQKVDSSLVKMLSPYADSVNHSMNKVIGFSLQALYKKQPESLLGNFMTDAVRTMASKRMNRNIDAAFLNYGGVRGNIPKGDITIGHIYELMPFDNLVILLELTGEQLTQFINLMADRGGWPSSGVSFKIDNKKATNILVNGKPLAAKNKYIVAVPDYVANGGDDAALLKTLPQINQGYLIRDALIEYVQQLNKEGKAVTANIENRITNVNQ